MTKMVTMTKMVMRDTVDGDKNGGDVHEDINSTCVFRCLDVVYHVKSLRAFTFSLYKSNQRSTFSL